MKGGLVLIGGNCGYMAAFMGQKGALIVCGGISWATVGAVTPFGKVTVLVKSTEVMLAVD